MRGDRGAPGGLHGTLQLHAATHSLEEQRQWGNELQSSGCARLARTCRRVWCSGWLSEEGGVKDRAGKLSPGQHREADPLSAGPLQDLGGFKAAEGGRCWKNTQEL